MTRLLLSGSDALLLGNDVVYVTVEGIVCVVVGTVVDQLLLTIDTYASFTHIKHSIGILDTC